MSADVATRRLELMAEFHADGGTHDVFAWFAKRELEAKQNGSGVQPIATAPRDGSKFDVWTVHGDRITDVWVEGNRFYHWWIGGFDTMGPQKITDQLMFWNPRPTNPVQS